MSAGSLATRSSRWAAEAPGEEKFATVMVIVEGDPHRGIPIDGAAEAKALADQRFKAEHPEGEIEWDRYVS